MAKYLATGTLTTNSGAYEIEVGTTHGGELRLTVLSAALHKAPGVVDSTLLRGKRLSVDTEEEQED